jgi:membrane associated rhomboid family serine protease
MTPTPVGMRCPECSRQRTKVRTAQTLRAGAAEVTRVLIGINVLAWVAELSSGGYTGNVYIHGALFGPSIADGDYWRLLTSGFLHAPLFGRGFGPFHLLFNMLALYILGSLLEPVVGRLRFGLIYAVSLLCGSFGALLLSPNALTAGASGAIFGLLGAAFVMARARGIDVMASGILPIILLNLVITFAAGREISIGGHLGGLIGGVVAAAAMEWFSRRGRSPAPALALCAVLAVAAVIASVAVAHSQYPA